jgi:hypothetical protein
MYLCGLVPMLTTVCIRLMLLLVKNNSNLCVSFPCLDISFVTICHHLPCLTFVSWNWMPTSNVILLFLVFQEPQITSREKQKSIMLGSAASNQAVWHSLSLSFNELKLDHKFREVKGDTSLLHCKKKVGNVHVSFIHICNLRNHMWSTINGRSDCSLWLRSVSCVITLISICFGINVHIAYIKLMLGGTSNSIDEGNCVGNWNMNIFGLLLW